MKNTVPPKVPNNVSEQFNEIYSILANLCSEKINDEYLILCVQLAVKIARKRPSPFLSGRVKTWAAGIIHAIGTVNFLFDKSQTPHITSRDLSLWFDLGQGTISSKSKSIREMMKIRPMDPSWCLPSEIANNPLVWMVSCDGYIIDIRHESIELQTEAYNAGVIPYIPGEKKKV